MADRESTAKCAAPNPAPSPACLRALADATLLAPKRNRAWDGIMGDLSHQKRKSDHNQGNAFDLTHDPTNGVDCNTLVRLALLDYRVEYVIWNRQIYNKKMPDKGWRGYKGAPHDHHMHVSIRADLRDIGSPWPWAMLPPAQASV
ncbi:hypothetical protein NX774_19115 [Massilia agilis]|uniref:ARB-07466-like C-terminal domain-containing protein n=1 Tax=Massilia agilis TaxID=1811226 RepID=A0ABT2DFD3_9BURK|nr:hypothetical protein [Massilia agilis]MCS0810039.1 hypothetical protein [Massilia agilis]